MLIVDKIKTLKKIIRKFEIEGKDLTGNAVYENSINIAVLKELLCSLQRSIGQLSEEEKQHEMQF